MPVRLIAVKSVGRDHVQQARQRRYTEGGLTPYYKGNLRIIRANALTIFVEIGLDARDSICSPAALERGEYVHHEHAVLQDVLALLAHVRCVVATARHLHHAAK